MRPPSGPPHCDLTDGVLTVDGGRGFWQLTMERRGDAIVPTYARGAVDCGGASVHNVDLIRIGTENTIDFRGGPFAPGATPEPDGSPEIEWELQPGLAGYFWLQFGNGTDHVTLGGNDGKLGLNLNAEEAVPDVDMTFAPSDLSEPEPDIALGGGADRLSSLGAPGFSEPFVAEFGFSAEGGPGADVLRGGPGGQSFEGGGGRDSIVTGSDTDYVEVAGGGRDRVDCGSSRDYATADRGDSLKSCERHPGRA